MNVQILGAHNCESESTRLTCLLVDGILAIDAGGLTSGLSFTGQQKLKAILLTHYHYDHIRDIPAIAMNLFLQNSTISIYSTLAAYDALTAFLLNNTLYPDFLSRPPEKPAVKFTVLKPYQSVRVEGYDVMVLPVHHAVPTVGYQVTAPDGKSLFYTGDTGPSLAECWQKVTPQLLVIEVTGPDRYQSSLLESGHLTPKLLEKELTMFREIRGYFPEVVTVHMNPYLEKEIKAELNQLAKKLGHPIKLAYEGMQILL